MLTAARVLAALLGVAAIVLSVQIVLERRLYDQPFDPVVIPGLLLGILLLGVAAFALSSASGPRLLAWAGIVAIVFAGAYLPFVAVTRAQDAIAPSLVPLAIALALAAILARGRVAADRTA